MSALARWLCAAALVVTVAAASAQTIYRCGHSYSRIPCTGATAVDVESRTTAAQRAEAHAVAARETRLAAEMARDRRAQEAALRPATASSLGPAPPAAAALPAKKKATKKQKKPAGAAGDDGRDFVATVPKATKPGARP